MSENLRSPCRQVMYSAANMNTVTSETITFVHIRVAQSRVSKRLFICAGKNRLKGPQIHPIF